MPFREGHGRLAHVINGYAGPYPIKNENCKQNEAEIGTYEMLSVLNHLWADSVIVDQRASGTFNVFDEDLARHAVQCKGFE